YALQLQHSFPTRRSSDLIQSRISNALATAHEFGNRFPQRHWLIRPNAPQRPQISLRYKEIRSLDPSACGQPVGPGRIGSPDTGADRKSTRLNSSHEWISY